MKQNQQYYEQQEKKQQYTTTTSSTTKNTEPGVLLLNMQVEQLIPLYEECCNSRMTGPVQQYLVRLLKAGMEPAVIASAISATAWARVPTPYYMRAILRRYMAEGIMTEAQLNHDACEHDIRTDNYRDEKEETMYF